MASAYTNDLRLEEIATGEQSGTWGNTTNTNLEIIAEAFSFGTEAITTNANTHTSTIADGATDEARSMYLKYTGALDSDCTITIGPNTVSKLWFIENATTDSGSSGPYNIVIKQGTGATVTIPNGDTKVIYSDGAGSGGAMVDAFASISTVDLKVQDDLTVTDDASVGGDLLVSGEVQTANIGFTDGDNAITIADGGGITAANGITSTAASNSFGATSFNDANITNVGDIALDSLSADGSSISIASPVVINGTTPSLTIGDAGAEDTSLVFDGNAKDFYVGLDDSADKLVVGVGSTVGTNSILTLDDDSVVIGDGAEVDTSIVFDGNAQDFYIALDDSADDLLIGNGSTVGSNIAIGINASQVVKFNDAYTFPTSDGSANQVLQTNGSGALSFATVSSTPTAIQDADGDTKVQCEESSDEDIIRFDTAGTERATIDNSGIVKITTPHASGGAQIVLQSSDASDADDEDYGSISFQNNGDTTLAQISGVSEGSANNKSHLRFSTKSGSGALTQQMLIRDNNLIQISGALSKGSGSFEIPHPLESKRASHYLRHSFIEGPQCDNIYRGTVTLSGGSASVNLDTVSNMTDGTFVALNTDVQVFTTNESDWDSVKGSVSGNVLTISCQNSSSSATVSWLVIGERQDDVIVSSPLTDGSGKLILEPEIFEGGT